MPWDCFAGERFVSGVVNIIYSTYEKK